VETTTRSTPLGGATDELKVISRWVVEQTALQDQAVRGRRADRRRERFFFAAGIALGAIISILTHLVGLT
jgi:hypothetical protein